MDARPGGRTASADLEADLPAEDDPKTPSADSPPGGGRGRSGVLGLLALVLGVALVVVLTMALSGGGAGPTR